MTNSDTPANFISQPPQFTQQQLAEAYFTQKDDEIDLRELFMALWKGKWTIIITTVIFAIAAIVYALTAQQWWSAKATVTQPELYNISQLRQQVIQIQPILGNNNKELENITSPEGLFKQFVRSFNSIENKREFFDVNATLTEFRQQEQAETPDTDSDALKRKLYSGWYSKITSSSPKEVKGEYYHLSLQSMTQQGSKALLEDYIRQTQAKVQMDVIENLAEIITTKKEQLQQQKQVLQAQAQNKLYTELLRSEYAHQIASAASLNKPLENLNNGDTFAINLGADALNAKVNVLKSIKDLDVIEPKLTQIDTQLKLLNDFKLNQEMEFSPIYFLENVEQPINRDKPKRALIAVLGTLLGGMLGVAVVLVGFAFRKGESEEVV